MPEPTAENRFMTVQPFKADSKIYSARTKLETAGTDLLDASGVSHCSRRDKHGNNVSVRRTRNKHVPQRLNHRASCLLSQLLPFQSKVSDSGGEAVKTHDSGHRHLLLHLAGRLGPNLYHHPRATCSSLNPLILFFGALEKVRHCRLALVASESLNLSLV